jgi:alpha-tubulin suppressor-like RCC1 family protein
LGLEQVRICLRVVRSQQVHTDNNNLRARIISPDTSDAAQIRTPAVASFLQDVALRDLAVHATHAACVDGRGDVYQWGDGFFGQQSEQSASSGEDDRKPVLTLQGKVRGPTFPAAILLIID